MVLFCCQLSERVPLQFDRDLGRAPLRVEQRRKLVGVSRPDLFVRQFARLAFGSDRDRDDLFFHMDSFLLLHRIRSV